MNKICECVGPVEVKVANPPKCVKCGGDRYEIRVPRAPKWAESK